MQIAGEFDYRNAKAPEQLAEIYEILTHPTNRLELAGGTAQRQLSTQLKMWFVAKGWKAEQATFQCLVVRHSLILG
jgi:hypothetical protein